MLVYERKYVNVMVQLTQIVTANAAAFVLLLIVKLHMNTQIGNKALLDARILRVMINLTMFQCFFDTLVFWVDGKTFAGAQLMNWIGNIVYYNLNGTIAYFWPLFAEYKISGSYQRVKKQATICAIPLLACALLVCSAPFNGIVFTISEDNIYSRTGFFFAIPMILIFVYVIIGTVNVCLNSKKGGKYMIFPAVYFVSPILLAMIVQMFNYGISLTFIGIAIGLTGVYMSTQNESAYIDQLCGVYNRRYYIDYIRAFCNSGKKGEMLTGVLIDMDDFKPINDKYGHHAGDKALMDFSSVLRKKMGNKGFAVRYGGDEFILVTKQSQEVAESVVAEIASEIDAVNASGANEYTLAFSYGIAAIGPQSSADDLLKAMDERMYDMKRARKAAK